MDGGFYVDLVNGSKPTSDTECLKKNSTGVTTRIIFTCNSTQKWTSRNLTGIIDVACSEPCTVCIVNTNKYFCSVIMAAYTQSSD